MAFINDNDFGTDVLHMPTLNWMGKEKVVNHHRDVPYRVLERIPEKGVLDSHGSDRGNMIIHGDNLEALKSLLPEYEGKVDCIYIDPPYNTGNEGWVYNDNVNDPRIKKWLGQVVGKEGEDFSRHDKWLCMMYPRLQLLRKLLAPEGCMAISISMHEVNNLAIMCREIFATSTVQIVTVKTSGGKPSNGFNVSHEYLIFICPPGFAPNSLSFSGGNARSPFEGLTLSTFDKTQRDNQVYPIYVDRRSWNIVGIGNSLRELVENGNYTGELKDFEYLDDSTDEVACVWPITSKGKPCVWRLIPERLRDDWGKGYIKVSPNTSRDCPNDFSIQYLPSGVISKIESGDLEVVGTENGRPTLIFGENSTVGGQIPTIWLEKEFHTTSGTQELSSLFADQGKVFDYPKPVRLVENVIHAVSNRNALVLDSFAGSGTTGHAVMNLNERDGGSRRYILIELSDYADSVTAERQRRIIGGHLAKRETRTRLYEKKLTSGNLKNAARFVDEAHTAINALPQGSYDTIDGPKMDGPSIVVEGVTSSGSHVPGIDSGFSYYELGPALFDVEEPPIASKSASPSISLNASVSIEAVRRYVWHTETRASYVDRTAECPWLLGENAQAAYYLAYVPGQETVLDYDLLKEFTVKGHPTVVYASRCALSQEQLDAMGIVFKQIPSQIARM